VCVLSTRARDGEIRRERWKKIERQRESVGEGETEREKWRERERSATRIYHETHGEKDHVI